MRALGLVVFMWIGVFAILIGCVVGAINGYFYSYEYEKVAGSHIAMAKDMIAPEQFIQELEAAKEGWKQLGLEDTDSSALIFKSYDNTMKAQVLHIDGVISRAKTIAAWRDKVYTNTTSVALVETNDMLKTKMDDIRNYLYEETRSDWIARDAYLVKNHTAYAWWSQLWFPILVVWGGLTLVITYYMGQESW